MGAAAIENRAVAGQDASQLLSLSVRDRIFEPTPPSVYMESPILLLRNQFNAGVYQRGKNFYLAARRREATSVAGVTADFSSIVINRFRNDLASIDSQNPDKVQELDFLYADKYKSVEDMRFFQLSETEIIGGLTAVPENDNPPWVGLLQRFRVEEDGYLIPQGESIELPFQCKNITPLGFTDGKIQFLYRDDTTHRDSNIGDGGQDIPLFAHSLFMAEIDPTDPPENKEDVETSILKRIDLPTDISYALDRIGTVDGTRIPMDNGNFMMVMHGQTILYKDKHPDDWKYVYTLFVAEFTPDWNFVASVPILRKKNYNGILPGDVRFENNKDVAYSTGVRYDHSLRRLRVFGSPGDIATGVSDFDTNDLQQRLGDEKKARKEGKIIYFPTEEEATAALPLAS